MTVKRLTIRDLTITDGHLTPAAISFAPGLNLIIGASDTGKTFIFEALDFMLGAKDGLRRIPESHGYSRVSLTVDPSEGSPFTLQRAMDGGSFTMTEYADGRDEPATDLKTLSIVHSPEPDSSLSANLLERIGIGSRQVRKNVQGEKKSLSFRHVAHLTLVDEERIIQQSSPVLSSHDTENTAEANVFAYFLTGQDDSAIIPQENTKSRKTRLATEAALLENLLEERRSELQSITSVPDDLLEQASRLEVAISEATNVVVASREQISDLESIRAGLFGEKTEKQSRSAFLQEQLKQLRLLDEYYRTDRSRLDAVIEASRVLHDLPEGTCPLCKQVLPGETDDVPAHEVFEAACVREVNKIASLQADLASAVRDARSELGEIQVRIAEVDGELRQADEALKETLVPASGAAQSDLRLLIRTRTSVAQSAALHSAIEQLECRLAAIQQAQSERVSKPVFEPRATTSSANEFCKVVEDILKAWHYPDLGSVAFDTDKCDLVIGGKDRANTGKGYRAITYAAFVIGLMKYCRKKFIPHPGFVVLDTPINPYKGPSTTDSDRVSEDVKTAFFKYLADDTSGDQVIIMENQDPPADVSGRVTCYNFTRNVSLGRYGFFPQHDLEAKSEPTA